VRHKWSARLLGHRTTPFLACRWIKDTLFLSMVNLLRLRHPGKETTSDIPRRAFISVRAKPAISFFVSALPDQPWLAA
jgi:hypothetical protein